MGLDEVKEAFKAGYHCRWNKQTGVYTFDPLLAPGDPDGAFEAWCTRKVPTFFARCEHCGCKPCNCED